MSGDYFAGTKQILEFTASGDLYLSVQMSSEQGTYEMKGDVANLFGETNSSYQWFVKGDSLSLNAIADEKSFKYLRMKQ